MCIPWPTMSKEERRRLSHHGLSPQTCLTAEPVSPAMAVHPLEGRTRAKLSKLPSNHVKRPHKYRSRPQKHSSVRSPAEDARPSLQQVHGSSSEVTTLSTPRSRRGESTSLSLSAYTPSRSGSTTVATSQASLDRTCEKLSSVKGSDAALVPPPLGVTKTLAIQGRSTTTPSRSQNKTPDLPLRSPLRNFKASGAAQDARFFTFAGVYQSDCNGKVLFQHVPFNYGQLPDMTMPRVPPAAPTRAGSTRVPQEQGMYATTNRGTRPSTPQRKRPVRSQSTSISDIRTRTGPATSSQLRRSTRQIGNNGAESLRKMYGVDPITLHPPDGRLSSWGNTGHAADSMADIQLPQRSASIASNVAVYSPYSPNRYSQAEVDQFRHSMLQSPPAILVA